jgi:HAD superfamily hydrolase (TIGR01509 family)
MQIGLRQVATGGWALLIDLDETLVITAAIEPLRRRRQWSAVYQAFPQTSLPAGTLPFIDGVRQWLHVGVVTRSPRTYAERLLEFHGLTLPVLVAYHDVTRQKPHPEPFLKAAQLLGLHPGRCICVGDSPEDALAAERAGAIPINLCWDGNTSALASARYVCENWDEVASLISMLTR